MSYPTIALGEIAETVMGQAPPGKDCNKEGRGTVFVKAGEFSDPLPLIREWTTRPLKMSKASDVLVCVVGATAGKVNRSINCAIGRSVAAVRPKSGRLDTDFLFHFLTTKVSFLRQKSQGLAQGVITRDMLEALRFQLPPLDEQKRIAAILDKADTLRRKRRETVERLEELRRSVFDEIFGDPATNPKQWPNGTVADVTESTQYGTSAKAGDAGEFPILRMGNITYRGSWELDVLKFINLASKDVPKYTVEQGDILFNRTNSPDLVGKTAVFRENQRYAFAGYLVRLRVNQLADAEYVSAYLNSTHGKATLRGMCKSIIGMANINARELCSIRLLLPPIELQQKFASLIAETRKSEKIQNSHLFHLHTLFSSLQHRAFRGEL
ncbi:MAG: restriction endonuclease subunit S [Hyphomicrobiales bacterium]|nr:restriction endonuclease subunit S [Hyphomicrobiales bacterium]